MRTVLFVGFHAKRALTPAVMVLLREGCKIFDPKTQLDEIKKCNVPIDKKTLICNP